MQNQAKQQTLTVSEMLHVAHEMKILITSLMFLATLGSMSMQENILVCTNALQDHSRICSTSDITKHQDGALHRTIFLIVYQCATYCNLDTIKTI